MRGTMKRLGLALGGLLAVPAIAWGVVEYQAGGGPVGAQVLMWLNGAGQAVPASPSNPMPVFAPPITPVAPSGSLTLAAGGVSQALATAGSASHGCQLYNPATAAQQGVSVTESAFVTYTGGSTTTSAGGQSFEVLPGASFSCPPGLTTGLSWNAPTTGHKITAVVW